MDTVEDREEEYLLTTVDNVYNPFTQFDEWLAYDMLKGYNTTNLLARVTFTAASLSEADQEQAIQLAIDQIVNENVSGVHRKVTRESFHLND